MWRRSLKLKKKHVAVKFSVIRNKGNRMIADCVKDYHPLQFHISSLWTIMCIYIWSLSVHKYWFYCWKSKASSERHTVCNNSKGPFCNRFYKIHFVRLHYNEMLSKILVYNLPVVSTHIIAGTQHWKYRGKAIVCKVNVIFTCCR